MLIENSNFRLKDIPNYHPELEYYDRLEFWKGEKRKCIEGYWSYDETGYRFMPPSLYFYGNFFKITVTDKGKKTRLSARPTIRDIDWHIGVDPFATQFVGDDVTECKIGQETCVIGFWDCPER